MDISEEFKKIDSFFENLTVEEFESIAIRCGIDEIKPLSDFGMEMAISSSNSYMNRESFCFNNAMQYYKIDARLVEAV